MACSLKVALTDVFDAGVMTGIVHHRLLPGRFQDRPERQEIRLARCSAAALRRRESIEAGTEATPRCSHTTRA